MHACASHSLWLYTLSLLCSHIGADAVSILSEMVSECNVRERFDTKEETWPLDYPRNFKPLHYHGKYITK